MSQDQKINILARIPIRLEKENTPMMNVGNKAIEIFVAEAVYSEEISKLMDGWGIDTIFVRNVLINYFRGLGIEFVRGEEENRSATKLIKTVIKTAPEIKQKLAEMKRASEEAALKKKRNG